VDDYYGMFVKDVALGRGVDVDAVRNGFGEGRVVGAADSVRLGMSDGISSLEGVVHAFLQTRPIAATAPSVTWTATSASAPAVIGWTTSELAPKPDPEPVPDPDPDPFVAEMSAQVAELGGQFEAAVDGSAWDGNRAMGQCSTAAEYRSICAGEHGAGEPDQRQHWALPHHYLGRGPNAAGVRAALSRLPQTQDLTNRGAAQRHLDAHMGEIGAVDETPTVRADDEGSLLDLQARLSALSE